jgi:hypothetical protein
MMPSRPKDRMIFLSHRLPLTLDIPCMEALD